jgi:glycosyltransferase involved in cell wall biosynthesis
MAASWGLDIRERFGYSVTLKVVVLAPRIFSEGVSGGGERYTSEFVRALSRLPEMEVCAVVGESLFDLRLTECEGPKATRITLNALRRLARAADILHLHQLDSPIGDLALFLGRLARRPVVLTDLGGGWASLGRLAGRRRLGALAALQAISLTSAEDLRWPAHRPQVVLYGGGDHLPSPAPKTVGKHFDFVFVGRLVPHKGALALLNALPDGASCLVMGSPLDPAYTAQVAQAVRRKGVTMCLAPTDSEIAAGLAASSWVVCPTQEVTNGKSLRRPELLGLTAIESYVLGTRAVLPDIPAFAELAPLIGAELYSRQSVNGLGDILRARLGCPYLTIPSQSEEFFSWSSVAERAKSSYIRIIESEAK